MQGAGGLCIVEGTREGAAPCADALARAWAVQRDAASLGFDWPQIAPVLDKVAEELDEIREALALGDFAHAQTELGDLLFAAVNVARFLDIPPATALHATTDRFTSRFDRVCALVRAAGNEPENCTLEELDAAWEQAKMESRHNAS